MKSPSQSQNLSMLTMEANRMFKKFLIIVFSFVSFTLFAAGDQWNPIQRDWSFDGFTGKFDRNSIQRGFKVYKEVCSVCHSLKRIAFRNLEAVGFSAAEIKSLASTYEIADGPNDDGEMFMRPGQPSDFFPSPYANEKAARAANNGAYPPDLSLMVKARPDGANYLYSLLNGYEESLPEGFELAEGMSYNPYFPGMQIAMIQPLTPGQVEYPDGTETSVHQMSVDLVNFLQWAAEPELEIRNNMGIQTMIYLAFFTLFFYVSMRKIWSRVK